jgi:hypothetical protein
MSKDKIIESLTVALIIGVVSFFVDMSVRLNKAEGHIGSTADKIDTIRVDVKDLKNCVIFKKCEVSR